VTFPSAVTDHVTKEFKPRTKETDSSLYATQNIRKIKEKVLRLKIL
jgi:hypothetical protein